MKAQTTTLLHNRSGFLISFLLHSLALFFFIYEFTREQLSPSPQQQNFVSISLNNFELPQESQPMIQQQQQKQCSHPKKHTKAVPQKSVEKIMPNPLPIEEATLVKKEEIVPEKVIEPEAVLVEETPAQEIIEESPEVVKEENALENTLESQESISEKQAVAPPSSASLQKQYEQTNFEIIRNMVLSHVKYPNMAKRMHLTGIVELLIVINTNGELLDVLLHKSSGHKLLDKSAIKAANQLQDSNLPTPDTTSKIILPIAFALT